MTNQEWFNLGREPLEFKPGDIVKRGEHIYEIREVADNGKTFIVGDVLTGTKRFNRFQCDLICPNKWRLN